MGDDMEKYAKVLYEKVKGKFPSEKVTAGNIFDLMRISMEEAEKFKELEGRAKKELVIRIINEAIKDFVVDEIENESLRLLVDNFMDVLIDTFVDIDFGNLKINEDQKKVIRKLFPCCF
jgi:hypothetical protein